METDPRWDMMNAACPTRQVLDRIADKWTMLVISALEDGTLRFSELRRQIDGITQKMLTQTLRALERDGMVDRQVWPTVPVTVRYTLTPLGHSLADAVSVIRGWAYENMDAIAAARGSYEPGTGAPPTPMATPAD
ncbi:MAG: HxlR family transcriptional regulator [Solirubrobacterales bacterium]|nr:HxlR family transcriptional regulator [Solirubrobacterales bacterium]